MARTINPQEHANRRNEILNVAQKLVYTKGYDQMSIDDIINELKISKGAFYHYYPSKPALLEALTDRIQLEARDFLLPLISGPELSALEKLQIFFSSIGEWKTDRKAILMSILRVYYADENAIVRQKMLATGVKWVAPILNQIARQGLEEGVFTLPYPDMAGEVILSFSTGLSETIANQVLNWDETASPEEKGRALQNLQDITAAYNLSIERILGAPPGSLNIFNLEILKRWLTP